MQVKMDPNPIKDAFDCVTKKQKMSGSKTPEYSPEQVTEAA